VASASSWEERIAVRFGATQLEREAAIRRHLVRDEDVLEPLAAIGEEVLPAQQPGVCGHLHEPAGAVVVLRLALGEPVLVRGHPRDVLREPGLDRLPVGRPQRPRRAEHLQRPRHFHEVDGIDDPDPAAGHAAVDGLRVAEVRVHARLRRHEPGAQVADRVVGILPRSGQAPGGGQRGDLHAQPHQRAPVLHEVVRVRHAVALHVGTARVLGLRPEVVGLGEEIVGAARAARGARRDDGHRLLAEIAVRRLEDAGAIERAHVEWRGSSGEKAGQEDEERIHRSDPVISFIIASL
jgi:hypothetical protein